MGKSLQHTVEHISHIHCFKAEFLTLLQFQSILQKMPVCTCRIGFHPADAVHQDTAVQSLCHRTGKPVLPVMVKCSVHKLFHHRRIVRILPVSLVKGIRLFCQTLLSPAFSFGKNTVLHRKVAPLRIVPQGLR